ncbi:hypothetical protein COSO111634_20840 [Corallococcus soli]
MSCVVTPTVASVGPYRFTSRPGGPARSTARAASAFAASPAKSTTRIVAKASGTSRATVWNRAVANRAVVAPTSRRVRASSVGASVTSRGRMTSRAPLSSAPHTSKVARSNDGVPACTMQSSGVSRAKSVSRTRCAMEWCVMPTPLGAPVEPDV